MTTPVMTVTDRLMGLAYGHEKEIILRYLDEVPEAAVDILETLGRNDLSVLRQAIAYWLSTTEVINYDD